MNLTEIKYCPSTLSPGYNTYSRTALKKVLNGKKVHHVLPYNSPKSNYKIFDNNTSLLSISGVQEKFSVVLDKNILRLVQLGERGTHILKPIPSNGKKANQIPANEHLTMQIAKQVYDIETAENALIFFKDGEIAYLTKRFDINAHGQKLAQDDFASLAKRTPQTHGEHYKYLGNYLQLFQLMKEYLPIYKIEAPKLLKQLIFNYLFSNGDAHFKNFSLIETPMGDYKLSPAYDLLNSRIHIDDKDFALEDGLLPKHLAKGKMSQQFKILAQEADINEKTFNTVMQQLLSKSTDVQKLVEASFLNESTKRNYWQSYQGRLKQLLK